MYALKTMRCYFAIDYFSYSVAFSYLNTPLLNLSIYFLLVSFVYFLHYFVHWTVYLSLIMFEHLISYASNLVFTVV